MATYRQILEIKIQGPISGRNGGSNLETRRADEEAENGVSELLSFLVPEL